MELLSKEEIKKLYDQFNTGEIFQKKKNSIVMARYAEPGETIVTIVDSKIETIRKASFGDIIVMNPTIGGYAEKYVMDSKTFFKRNDIKDEIVTIDGRNWISAQSKGEVTGFFYKGEPIKFKAPWDQMMVLNTADFLARPVGGSLYDIYRIERGVFTRAYIKTDRHINNDTK